MSLLMTIWHILTEPSHKVIKDEDRRTARLLSCLLIPLLLLLIIGHITIIVLRPNFPNVMVYSLILIVVSYILSRTQYLKTSGILAVVSLSMPSFVYFLTPAMIVSQSPDTILIWLVIPIIVCMLVLPMWLSLSITGIIFLLITLATICLDNIDSQYVIRGVSFLFVVATAASVAVWAIERSRKEIQKELGERRRVELQLQHLNEQLEQRVAERTREIGAFVTSSPAAVVTLNTQGVVTLWNPAAENIFGWTAPEVLEKPNPLLSAGNDFDPKKPFGIDNRDQAHTGLELQFRAKDDTQVHAHLCTSPLRDSQGCLVGTTGIFIDITERKSLEDQLVHSQKIEAIGQLAGGVAHDFNNLLTIINGYVDFILTEIEPLHPVRQYAEEIAGAGERAARLTRQLLAFGRRQIFNVQSLDLNEIIQDMHSMLRRLVREDVNLNVRLSKELGVFEGDRNQVEQVIINLVVNANDAMPKGGDLSVETKRVVLEHDHELYHKKDDNTEAILLVVSDNGIGMNDETRRHIFEPFFTTKEPGHGTGLGLSTVYGIVHQSSGVIEVESNIQQGTTFKVLFPHTPVSTDRVSSIDVDSVPFGNETILVVEDERRVRELTSRMLSKLGYTVIEASNGEEAIDLFEMNADAISLVLSDVIMPQMGGVECAQKIRSLKKDMPILFLSGHTDRNLEINAVLSSGIRLLQKPIDFVKLATEVRNIIDCNHTEPWPTSSQGDRVAPAAQEAVVALKLQRRERKLKACEIGRCSGDEKSGSS